MEYWALVMEDHPYPETFEEWRQFPEPYLTAIGRVVVNWCNLESVVDKAIGKLAGFNLDDPTGVIVTAHMTWPQKMDTLQALVGILNAQYPHLTPKFNIANPLVKQAQKGRNRIVHGLWGIEDGVVCKLNASARGTLKFRVEPISVEEIAEISLNIGNAALAVLKMVLNK
ncbi:MAG TPA: hypothetical protein VEK35_02325 [Roseiarcus sp.]|nr:hypothetical protein [Roseiarcus sp.]